eukprot:1601614-Rhodomonas_salina.4
MHRRYELACVRRSGLLQSEYIRGDIHPKEVVALKGDFFVELASRVGDGRLYKVMELLSEDIRPQVIGTQPGGSS